MNHGEREALRHALTSDLDDRTAIHAACTMLELAGYSGAFSFPVKDALEYRLDVVKTAKLRPVVFYQVIHQLVSATFSGSAGPADGPLTKRVTDQDKMMSMILESNGVLLQSLR
jgi:hypothetical protein